MALRIQGTFCTFLLHGFSSTSILYTRPSAWYLHFLLRCRYLCGIRIKLSQITNINRLAARQNIPDFCEGGYFRRFVEIKRRSHLMKVEWRIYSNPTKWNRSNIFPFFFCSSKSGSMNRAKGTNNQIKIPTFTSITSFCNFRILFEWIAEAWDRRESWKLVIEWMEIDLWFSKWDFIFIYIKSLVLVWVGSKDSNWNWAFRPFSIELQKLNGLRYFLNISIKKMFFFFKSNFHISFRIRIW